VKLGSEKSVEVDMIFEGSLAAQVPLCLSGEDSGAAKLGKVVGASQVVVVRNGSPRGNPPSFTGALYAVEGSERVRNAAVRPERIRDLMRYLLTGKPDISQQHPPPAEPATAALTDAVAQPLAETGRFEARPSPWRPIGYTALGVGAATAIAGAIVFATAARVQTDANGNVPVEDAERALGAQAQQGLGVGLMVGGAALSAGGALAWLLSANGDARVRASVVPMIGGGVVVLGGEFK
jgi:hypothetical protein